MTIIIDSNEPIEVDAAILDADGDCKRRDLSTGDFLVGEFIIERKKYNDFEKRLTTEKISIWRQLDAMCEAASDLDYDPILLMEGSRSPLSGVHDHSIAGAFASVLKKDVSIIPIPSVTATGQFLVTLDHGDTHAVESVRQSPSVSARERPQHLTEGFPGIGPAHAVALLAHFGDFISIVNADVGELQAVPGIGQKRAEEIHGSVRIAHE